MKPCPRVVLDTNVVLSALVFSSPAVARIRQGWQSGAFVPLASAGTVSELVRVLAYPKFKLTPSDQEELLADYLPAVRVVHLPDPLPRVPACRDPFDVVFLHLAAAGKAQYLVSGDKDLLALRGGGGVCPIMAIDEFCRDVLASG